MTVLETNAARVNEQLGALGRRSICGFHHEARELPDGSIVLSPALNKCSPMSKAPAPSMFSAT